MEVDEAYKAEKMNANFEEDYSALCSRSTPASTAPAAPAAPAAYATLALFCPRRSQRLADHCSRAIPQIPSSLVNPTSRWLTSC